MSRLLIAATASVVLLANAAVAEKHTMTMPAQNLTCEDVLNNDIILDDPILREQYNTLRTQCLALPVGSVPGDISPLVIAAGGAALLAALIGSSSTTTTTTN